MPDARLAEFLLRRATTPERASAIAGDLLEQYPNRSFRLALAVARILIALHRKQILGFVAALFFFMPLSFTSTLLFLVHVTRSMGLHQAGCLENLSRLLWVGTALLAISAFAFTKTSTKRVATVSLMLATASFSAACYAFLNQTSQRSPQFVTLGVALILIATPASRRASIFSLAAAAAVCITPMVVFKLAWTITSLQDKPLLVLSLSLFGCMSAVGMGILTLSTLQRYSAPPPVIK